MRLEPDLKVHDVILNSFNFFVFFRNFSDLKSNPDLFLPEKNQFIREYVRVFQRDKEKKGCFGI